MDAFPMPEEELVPAVPSRPAQQSLGRILRSFAPDGLAEARMRAIVVGQANGCPFPVTQGAEHGIIRRHGDHGFDRTHGDAADLRGERLSELLQRAGGLTPQAYAYGTIFTRESVRLRQQDGFARAARDIETSLLSVAAGQEIRIRFTPHLVPMNRGILSTLYVDLAEGAMVEQLHAVWTEVYAAHPFVQILPQGELPKTRDVRGSNFCHIGVAKDRLPGKAVIVSVIDNLVKGAAGQAVQNANRMFGLDETTGLMQAPLFP